MNNLARQPQKMLRPAKAPRRREKPGVPTGWRKLHEIAVTLDANLVQAYGDTELGEFFGVVAQAEADSAERARRLVRSESRPRRTLRLGQKQRGSMRSRHTDRLHRIFNDHEGRHWRRQRREDMDTAREENDYCSTGGSGAGPPKCNQTISSAGYAEQANAHRMKSIRLTRGSPPEPIASLTTDDKSLRWKYGCCATEFVCDSDSVSKPENENRETRILRPRILRPPKVSVEKESDRYGQLRCWTESAILYIQRDDETQRVAVNLNRRTSSESGDARPRMQMIRPKVPRRATQKVVRRLNPGSKGVAKTMVTRGPAIRTARDGPPTVEVDS
ncbi:MAG: hypothetical protein VYA30_05430 [Myxococcota bacterium]|nr:hypothetical protein [Myxococcota bacterium]